MSVHLLAKDAHTENDFINGKKIIVKRENGWIKYYWRILGILGKLKFQLEKWTQYLCIILLNYDIWRVRAWILRVGGR